jgi:hypothetical protein
VHFPAASSIPEIASLSAVLMKFTGMYGVHFKSHKESSAIACAPLAKTIEVRRVEKSMVLRVSETIVIMVDDGEEAGMFNEN